MNHVKKALAFVMTLVMALAVAVPAYAATEKGSITIGNSAKGETYSVFKLFDVVPSTDKDNGSYKGVRYTGTIPSGLGDYFETVTEGSKTFVQPKAAAMNGDKLSDAAVSALKAWAEDQDATDANTKTGTGGDLVFDNLELGYYVVTTSQGTHAITVDTTMPQASVIDKNTTTTVKDPVKTIVSADGTDKVSASIGTDIEYSVKFGTSNYNDETGKKIAQYIVKDTHDDRNIIIKSGSVNIKIGELDENGAFKEGYTELKDLSFTRASGSTVDTIPIDWVDQDGNSLYKNGATMEITYLATVQDTVAIDGEGFKNTVNIFVVDEGTPGEEHTKEEWESEVTAYTYAIAIQKVNKDGDKLAGAKFQLPFYVKANADTDGAYIYAGTEAGTGLVNELTTPEGGLIIVKGVAAGTYDITEVEAPAGYNKLTAAQTATATKTGQTTTSTKTYIEDGQIVDTKTENSVEVLVSIDALSATPLVIINNTGAEMPSTGGIGTTIFYVVGGVMVAGAVIMLLTKRRMAGAEE